MKTYTEDEYLPLSGIQHFNFCRRQWALIHIERLWAENYLTADGRVMHERAHNDKLTEKRGDTLTVRALKISSHTLGLSGECDVVEFHAASAQSGGVPLFGRAGLWLPFPVEYKRGSGTAEEADQLQLCAQAICLEEMLGCEIHGGALYYGENRHRTPVEFSSELRQSVQSAAKEMHELFERGHIPNVKPGKHCKRCSLADDCLPKITKNTSAIAFINARLAEDAPKTLDRSGNTDLK
jgi:CRISPR-associated exonuclease Cas4